MQKPSDALPGHRLEPRLRIYADERMILGWGKIMLLRSVRDTGSIAEAARNMDISYNHAWGLIRLMNASFNEPLVEAARGGRGTGGASISCAGEKVLRLYEEMAEECLKVTQDKWLALRQMLRPADETVPVAIGAEEPP